MRIKIPLETTNYSLFSAVSDRKQVFQKIRLNIIHLRAKVGGRRLVAPPTSSTNSMYIVKSLHRKTATKDMHSGFFPNFFFMGGETYQICELRSC